MLLGPLPPTRWLYYRHVSPYLGLLAQLSLSVSLCVSVGVCLCLPVSVSLSNGYKAKYYSGLDFHFLNVMTEDAKKEIGILAIISLEESF